MIESPVRTAPAVALFLALAASGAHARYTTAAVDNGGTVSGVVSFAGAVPDAVRVVRGKDSAVCGDGEVIPNPVSVGTDGGLDHVVVYLETVASGKPWPEREYELDQRECTFEPYLQVVPKGAELTIRNSDPVLHNVHPFEIIGDARRTMFNLAQPKQGQVNRKKIKTRRGHAVELACDAHAWMAGWLYVLEHPYFDVVGPDGAFSIDEIPPGSYRLVAWHPVLGTRAQDVVIGAGGSVEARIRFEGE